MASLRAYSSHGIQRVRLRNGLSARTLLHRRAQQKATFDGGPRRLLAELAELRCCRLIDITGRKGRPRVRSQLEETGDELRTLAETLGAIPVLR